MIKVIAFEHIIGLAIACAFVLVGAICLGYAARGITYAIAGLAGLALISGGLKALRLMMDEMDNRRGP